MSKSIFVEVQYVIKAVSILLVFVVLAGLFIGSPFGRRVTVPDPPGPTAPSPPAPPPSPSPTPSPSPSPEPAPGGDENGQEAGLLEKRRAAIEEADALALQYFYDEALEVLSDPEIVDETVSAKIAGIEAAKASLVNYEGDIKHIFFHSLIVYPEMIFRNKTTPMGGYNAGFSEKAEFEKILPQLYDRGYVLYDLNECYEKVNGVMTRKEILLPPGKQPLILSLRRGLCLRQRVCGKAHRQRGREPCKYCKEHRRQDRGNGRRGRVRRTGSVCS